MLNHFSWFWAKIFDNSFAIFSAKSLESHKYAEQNGSDHTQSVKYHGNLNQNFWERCNFHMPLSDKISNPYLTLDNHENKQSSKDSKPIKT